MDEIFIGCDIEDISRFRNIIENGSSKIFDKIFTKEEQKYCNSKPDPAVHYTGKFCAKEAVVKAIKSAKIVNYIRINQIEIQSLNTGQPEVKLKIKIKGTCKVSISHTSDYAISMALFIR